ncbi:MAG TPA: hypothetical protein VG736_05280 [Vicinamibacterales bacterium]|jgi:hypothetical protein|nr:hypothetical protein [Vicinamibacterales bacterium]
MTPNDSLSGAPASALLVTIDGLLDGEAIERERLRAALADAEAREYFVDALLIRQAARELTPPVPVASTKRPHAPWTRWLAAAVVVATVGAAGVGGGYTWAHHTIDVPAPVETVMDVSPRPIAPAPTKVIHLQPGVNWTPEVVRQ